MNLTFQEEENLNITENYFNFIKQVSEDYLKYISNYKIITGDYLKKLVLNHEKYSPRLLEAKDQLKNINSSHIISLTSIIPKVVDQQIRNNEIFIKGIEEKLENFEKLIKDKNLEFIECQIPFKEIKNELVKKYTQIDKLKLNYMTNIEIVEDNIHKFYIKKNSKKKVNSKINLIQLESNLELNTVSLEEQMNNSIQKTKKIEEDYITNITLIKTVEKKFVDVGEETKKKSRKILCEISTGLKELISDCMVFLRNSFKLPLGEIDTYLNEIVSLDEYTKFDEIINSSFKKDNDLKPINPEKYTFSFFQKNNTNNINTTNKFNIINKIININNKPKKNINVINEEGLQEMDFVQEEEIFMTIKKMIENFDLLEHSKYDLPIEEEKLRCKYLTLKILSFVPHSKLYSNKISNITPEEVEEIDIMLKKKQNRIIFIQKLSQFRTMGIFEIPEKEYNILSRLFNKIATMIESDEDYESAVNIIILSQTYYIIKNDKKQYLQSALMNNEFFKSKKFWETYTNYLIEREISLSKHTDELNGIFNENDKENEEKYSNIAFAQLIPIIDNMIEFELDINIVEEIILPLIKQYKIGPELAEAIVTPINNKKLETKNNDSNKLDNKEKEEEKKEENQIKENKEKKEFEIKEANEIKEEKDASNKNS